VGITKLSFFAEISAEILVDVYAGISCYPLNKPVVETGSKILIKAS
jgi:hypothetical protein